MKLYEISEPGIAERQGSEATMPVGLEFYLDGEIAKIRVATTQDKKIDILIDSKISQSAAMALAAGQKVYQGIIEENGSDIRLIEAPQPDTSQMATVILRTAPGVKGEVRLSANSFQEVEVKEKDREGRPVRRIRKEFSKFPPIGVEVINTSQVDITDNGICRWKPELHMPAETVVPVVLRLTAGANFRVSRSGDVGDAPRNFVVHWHGHILSTRLSGWNRN